EQIISILKQQESGRTTAEMCREAGISAATFYSWKASLAAERERSAEAAPTRNRKRQAAPHRGRSSDRHRGSQGCGVKPW
ncbi:MAG: transposase, partial [Armatimonadetes bacterium]|nr:transposase [Armatimonadota bacterium]